MRTSVIDSEGGESIATGVGFSFGKQKEKKMGSKKKNQKKENKEKKAQAAEQEEQQEEQGESEAETDAVEVEAVGVDMDSEEIQTMMNLPWTEVPIRDLAAILLSAGQGLTHHESIARAEGLILALHGIEQQRDVQAVQFVLCVLPKSFIGTFAPKYWNDGTNDEERKDGGKGAYWTAKLANATVFGSMAEALEVLPDVEYNFKNSKLYKEAHIQAHILSEEDHE